jgi:tellurite resistance protein TerC
MNNALFKWVKRAAILVIGLTVVLIGVAMIVLPGPAILVIPAGLAILATEFLWARRILERVKRDATWLKEKVMGKPAAAEEKSER